MLGIHSCRQGFIGLVRLSKTTKLDRLCGAHHFWHALLCLAEASNSSCFTYLGSQGQNISDAIIIQLSDIHLIDTKVE